MPLKFNRGRADGVRYVPVYFQYCKKVGQKSAMLQEIWPQYFPWPLFLGAIAAQLVKTPLPNGKCLGTSVDFNSPKFTSY